LRIVVWAALAAVLVSPALATERLVTGGVLRGIERPDGSEVFYAIPYAAPPVGERRFRQPEPVEAWQGVRDATKPPAPCLQHDEGWNADDAAKSREDCLYLSIHAPAHKPGDRLPVFFWIHGGSNKAGAGYGYIDSTIHHRGIVLVSVEYRLGVFGFLASHALSAEASTHTSGNLAILDQIAALHWVKDNIARFGGDPANVTIAGQSAGAYDVGVLMLSPLARGLFAKAIEESGTPGVGLPPRSAADNEALGAQLATGLGLADTADGLKALRSLPGDVVLKEGDKLVPKGGLDPSAIWAQAMVDGYVLREGAQETLAAGRQAHVPLISGSNMREFPVDMPDEAARAMVKAFYGTNADQALALYPADDPALGSLATRVLTDVIFRCEANTMAHWQTKAGQKAWRYQFGLGVPGSGKPVEHSSELKYVFDDPPAGTDPAAWPSLQGYWANFARSGNPNGPGLAVWPVHGPAASYIDFTPSGPKRGTDLRGPMCRLLSHPS
jgi:para-nitrobenzyl esterase